MKKRRNLLLTGLIFILIVFFGNANAAQSIRLSAAIDNVYELSQAQIQFAAENFDTVLIGQWDADIEKASELKFYNPEISIIGYINSKHLIPGSGRYQECTVDEDIFAHDLRGDRISSLDFGQVLTDIHNPDWTKKVIQWANELPSHFDGIFLDVAQPTLVESNYEYLPAGYNANQQVIAMKELFYNIRQEYDGTVNFNGLRLGINYDGYTTDVDAGAIEGFIFSGHRQNVELGAVQNHINALIEADIRGLGTSAISMVYKEDIGNRVFALACYLLGASDLSTYSLVNIEEDLSSTPLQYYPEYKIDLGNPLDFPNEVAELIDPETNMVIRHFERGMVIVNPWDDDGEIKIDGKYLKVIPYGGGVVGIDGTYDGYLEYEEMQDLVTVSGKTAVILISSPQDSPTIPQDNPTIVVNNGDQGTSYTGTWKFSDANQPWDSDSLYAWNSATYTWEGDIKGNLKVSMWWTTRNNSNSRARIAVYDGSRYVGDIFVNQRKNGGKWNVLGNHNFTSSPKIVIHANNRWVTTCADAVKFEVVD